MTKVLSFKMPFQTKHFNQNQRVWIVFPTGALAAHCCGRYRGSGRYITAWVRWDKKNTPAPTIQEFEVDSDFARTLGNPRPRHHNHLNK